MEVTKPYTVNLSAQMAVCDANYIRILQLLPEIALEVRREFTFSRSAGARSENVSLGTAMEVVEQFKYTSTVRITQQLHPAYRHYRRPEMLVRMYHDAKTAEVVSYQQHRYFKMKYSLPNDLMYQVDEKEQLNFFLAEWLTVCRKEGLCTESELSRGLQACLRE